MRTNHLALLVVLVLLVGACTPDTGSIPQGEGTTEASPAAAPVATTVVNQEPQTVARLPLAPWSAPPLDSEHVPDVLLTEWHRSESRLWCSLLAPAELGPAGEDAVPRRANFGPDAWAVAWDNPDGPGQRGDSSPCTNCGRSAFGIADSGIAEGDEALRWPTVLRWEDGSSAGYGNEGLFTDDSFVDPETGEAVEPRRLAYLVVAGQGCSYNVWSNLGPEHLEFFLGQLRFVEEHMADPIPFLEEAEPVVIDGGPPPWRAPPLDPSEVPSVLLDSWAQAGCETCRLLAPADLGEKGAAGKPRPAKSGILGVIWDLPNGPGLYGYGEYCADCGRQAFGIWGGSEQALDVEQTLDQRWPFITTWDDGSVVGYGREGPLLASNIPEDRFLFIDPETGEEAYGPPWRAQLIVNGVDGTYTVYTVISYLGKEHLEHLLSQLRFVEGYP